MTTALEHAPPINEGLEYVRQERSELAALYGVSTGTVSAILVAHGAVRSRGLTAEQVEQAVGANLAGDSLATIGRTLGVSADTVRARLLEQGVTMRARSGRMRCRAALGTQRGQESA